MFNELKIGQTRNDFSIRFIDCDWKSDWEDIMSSQATSLKINLLDGILEVSVRQLKTGVIQDIIFHILTSDERLIDGIRIRPAKSKKKGAEYVFNSGILVNHRMDLDYDSKDVILHRLTFVFDSITLHSPSGGEPVTHYPDVVFDDEEEDQATNFLSLSHITSTN